MTPGIPPIAELLVVARFARAGFSCCIVVAGAGVMFLVLAGFAVLLLLGAARRI